ncbi:TPA: hypothetical protein N0F65_012632 [Lagenidium giganteum]|uniref:Uncharacterized protein n=1 Tax=Lagenidium giganteum TaxID=4803 RepID=A0AAV2YHL0_9STRA|nr:TPA: hypothetical protein N0F65_012632 [Lagenidium giganteum]
MASGSAEGATTALPAALAAQVNAAVAFLEEEIAQLAAGAKDDCLRDVVRAGPLPAEQFQELLEHLQWGRVPAALSDLLVQLDEAEKREAQEQTKHEAAVKTEPVDEASSAKDDAAATATETGEADVVIKKDEPPEEVAAAMAGLKELRKSVLLDVLSKIVSVARSKGVVRAVRVDGSCELPVRSPNCFVCVAPQDPSMLSAQRAKGVEFAPPPNGGAYVDLDMIATQVEEGDVWAWEAFAQQVFLFCQLVIADSERTQQPDAKQKGVELLHFAKTLTDTMRKASLKKEARFVETIDCYKRNTSESASATADPTPAVATPPAVARTVQRPQVVVRSHSADSDTKTLVQAAAAAAEVLRQQNEPLTPQRASARIRQRTSSVSDSQSPSPHKPKNQVVLDDDSDAEESSGTRRRSRANSQSASAAATPTHASANATASDEASESESQVSASEAESKAGRGSAAQSPSETKRRTRKRRPILPATRMSSRQTKRRAREAEAAASAGTDDGNKDTDDADGDAEGNDTAADDEDDEKETPPARPVLLTKSGRPRKKPGRKPRSKTTS